MIPYKKSIHVILLSAIAILFILPKSAFNMIDEEGPVNKFRYVKIFNKTLTDEEVPHNPIYKILVRTFDFKHKNNKNSIVVAGRRLYIFSPRGQLLYQSSKELFKSDVQQIKIAKISRDGFYDTIVVSENACGPRYHIFDRLGAHLSSIYMSPEHQNIISFYAKDLNNDGTEEIITSDRAFYTKDQGLTWEVLYINESLFPKRRSAVSMRDIVGSYPPEKDGDHEYYQFNIRLSGTSDYPSGYIARFFIFMIGIDNKGDITFQTRIPPPSPNYYWIAADLPYATGDFIGRGIKDGVAVVGDEDNNRVFILNNSGVITNSIPLKILGSDINLHCNIIRAGKLFGNKDLTETIIAGGDYNVPGDNQVQHGIVVYNALGSKSWEFLTGQYQVTHVFIEDLDGDGMNEIVLCAGNRIIIISNVGKQMDQLIVDSDLRGLGWGSYNPAMDIADINGDGYKEIVAVTTKGTLYIFGVKKES